jgi:transcriptional regulator CtsR
MAPGMVARHKTRKGLSAKYIYEFESINFIAHLKNVVSVVLCQEIMGVVIHELSADAVVTDKERSMLLSKIVKHQINGFL